ncbi:MAG: hypothetical protein U5R31_01310 [Acidimicrobiia bacterium]|nr:hypothetical protein [Acidimicrobiia bacterium]
MLALVAVLTPRAAAGAGEDARDDADGTDDTAAAEPLAEACEDVFADVVCGQPFFDEIDWAAGEELVEGYPDGTAPAPPTTSAARPSPSPLAPSRATPPGRSPIPDTPRQSTIRTPSSPPSRGPRPRG